MGKSGAASLCVGSEGGEVGSGRGSDVLTHDESDAKIDGQHASGAEQDGDGHHGSRRLHDAGDDGADEQEDDDGEVAACVEGAEKFNYCRIMFEVEFLSGSAEKYK